MAKLVFYGGKLPQLNWRKPDVAAGLAGQGVEEEEEELMKKRKAKLISTPLAVTASWN